MNEISDNTARHSGASLLASYLLSLSLFSLAGAIIYFTYEVVIISKQIPDVIKTVDMTSDNIEPIIGEVGRIIDLIPGILKEVEETRKLVPPILKEVEQTRKQIPPILKEVENTRKQIPPILKESQAIRHELPAVLASVDKASDSVTDISKQIEETRPLIPKALKEIETTRESIPPMLDRVDGLIEKAGHAGKEASQGAVTGFFKGIIVAPFALVGDAGRRIAGMTEEEAKRLDDKDFDYIKNTSLVLLNNGTEGDERQWKNTGSGSYGTVKLMSIYTKGEYAEIDCRSLEVKIYKNDKLLKDTTSSFCKDDEGKWKIDQ
jgi:surface antigen/archaellum component FlaC